MSGARLQRARDQDRGGTLESSALKCGTCDGHCTLSIRTVLLFRMFENALAKRDIPLFKGLARAVDNKGRE